MKFLSLNLLLAFFASTALATNYYVDASSSAANDSNPGTSMSAPLKSLAPVNTRKFSPGDIVSIKRGTSYSGGLTITSSGTSAQPITFNSYGSGELPVISNSPTVAYSTAIQLQASYVVIENLKVTGAQEGGIRLPSGANNNIVRNNEMTDVGAGVIVSGQNNYFANNYIHDLKMIVNTQGGDDDYGANGFIIGGPNNEFAFNKCLRCIAPSYDYGTDGGMFELYGMVDNNFIHHNVCIDSDGLFEVGGSTGASAKNIRLAYNEIVNSRLGGIHASGTFATAVDNLRFENNTVIDTSTRSTNLSALFWVGGTLPTTAVVFKNNIFSIRSFQNVYQQNFSRANNLYHLLNSATGLVGGSRSLASAELITADPQFVDPASTNFHLKSTSPAIDKGLNLGYTMDLDGKPLAGAPDLGAFEYQAASPSPAPAPQPAPAPTPAPAPAPAPAPSPTPAPTLSTPQASSDTNSVYLQFNYTGNPTLLQIFLDTDANPGSGFSVMGAGADYLIENDSLYKFSGATNSTWGWTLVKTIPFNKTSSNISWTVARTDLGSPSALDFVGQVYSSETAKMLSSKVHLNLQTVDTTNPTVSITSPVNGSPVVVRTLQTIKVAASDNGAVDHVDIGVDGAVLCSLKVSPYNCSWTVPRRRGRTYHIQATAYDKAGNKSSAVISVTSQ